MSVGIDTMQVILFVAADYANKSIDGKLNILGIFNSINAPNFPARHRQLFLVIRLVAILGETRNKHNIRFLFVDEDGKELINGGGEFDIPHPEGGKQALAEFIVDVGDLHIPKPGRYEFQLMLNGEIRGRIPIEAVKIEMSLGQ